MATYGTDLVLLATGSDGSGGTWAEFIGWDSGGLPTSDAENFIQGAASFSQTFGNAVTGKSVAFDAGSDIASSIPSGDVVMGWVFIGAATNLYTYASGGWRFGIGASLTNFDMWSISGDDRPPNPYGGWWNVAVNPRVTPDYTGGTGSAGAWRYFGSIIGDTTLGIRAKIAKGSPHAVDGLLKGRGEIYCTGTGATFTLMAAQNDLVANRWGLLQDTGGGTFLWKGLMSFGQSGTSVTFSDSNKTVVIDDCPKTYAAFNKIEINNASSSVTLTNCAFTAKGTFAPGNFEMIANAATVALTGCSFNNMGTFVFQSNAAVVGNTFNKCGLVTQGGATFTGDTFGSSTGTALLANNPAVISGCTFVSKGTGYAIEINTPGEYVFNLNNFSGFATTGTPGISGNECIYNNSGGDVILNVSTAGTGTITYRNNGVATTTIVSSVPVSVTIVDVTNTPIVSAQVAIYLSSNDSELLNTDTDVNGQATTGYGGSTPAAIYVRVRKSSTGATKYIPVSSSGTITSTGYSATITLVEDITATI